MDTGQTRQVVIVGTGFAGLGMAIRLKKAGIDDFVILEKADEVGGTWRENTYPGCACDIPSRVYSFSFEPNPRWSRSYPEQQEILDYLIRCSERYDLRRHIRFGAELTGAHFDEEHDRWRIELRNGDTVTGRSLVLGLGPLHKPSYPDIEGLDRFAGPVFHSAEWDHSVDLAGKRVAVIGTGASAVQFTPRIAPEVSRLHLFQRTPPWVIPKPDKPIGARQRKLFAAVPALQRLLRTALFLQLDSRALGFTVAPKLMDLAEGIARRHIRKQVHDPELRRKVTPRYRMGCKRILPSNDYYPILNRSNVELVTDGIASVGSDSIRTADGTEREVDAILLATGFRVTDAFDAMDLVGVGGRKLSEAWSAGMEAHHGITVAGFPNLFILVGPNTGLGHNSMVFMIESQLNYVMGCLRRLTSGRTTRLDVRPEAQAASNHAIQDRLSRAVWSTGGCQSWYLDPATGRNTTLWPGPALRYWFTTRRPRLSDFRKSTST